ncbi:hypothetical protein ALQ64_01959 [Pseudomonas cannabina]|uniref:DNA 3'-5' helicase n=1 Tax=Pseudomonas cannabina TaxID=86840 RepID=A0A3M3LPZ8_PSECA|nr:ATP-dependent helicase [Pseudomonas cannabina]RMN37400.1 hypothetical protein ALQ64_01959 [Pseudomonas cannabina]
MALNEQQFKIVDLPLNASALVLAGAGSGKTTVVASRAVKLSGLLLPGQTLQLLTFANKAAKEMKERVKRLGNADLSKIRFDTFHSFGIRLLKDDPMGFKLTEGFTLLNDSDVKRSVRGYAKQFGLKKDLSSSDRKRLDPMSWLNTWSLARQAGFDVSNPKNREELLKRLISAHNLVDSEPAMVWMTLASFEKNKRSSNAVDFDDLIYLPLLRLARDEIYRDKVRSSIGYILVDEVQDTNRIQYELIKQVALGHCGVTAVGDDDQSIYGWRGAEVSNLRRFLVQFQAEELKLERNYRSTRSIVDRSVELIKHNQNRLNKEPFSESLQGTPVELSLFDDHRGMADAIAAALKSRIESGVAPSEMAVLYRTNRMALLLEQSLRRWNIPYHVVGGMSLFDRTEVTAVTSAIRLATNPRDIHALKTIADYIDGLGPGSVYNLAEWLEEEPSRSLCELPKSIPGISEKRLSAFSEFYGDLLDQALLSRTATEFVSWVTEGPMAVLDREKDEQIRARKEIHLESLAGDIQQELQDRLNLEPKLTWRDIVIEVALRDARQSESEEGQVTLSTIHRSKGLEWPTVFIAGASEGLMPLDSRVDLNSDEAGFNHIEEERRLAFVATTRAKDHCHFFHANRYFFPGGNDDREYEPSRFLTEMGLNVHPVVVVTDRNNDNEDFDFQKLSNDFARLRLGGM